GLGELAEEALEGARPRRLDLLAEALEPVEEEHHRRDEDRRRLEGRHRLGEMRGSRRMMRGPTEVEPLASAAGAVHAGLSRLAVDAGAAVGADLVEGLTEALAAEAELDVEGEAGGVVGAG